MPDVIRHLRALRGPDVPPSLASETLARRAVEGEIERERRGPRRRRRFALGLVPVVAVAGVVAGASYFSSRPSSLSIACASAASREPHDLVAARVDGRRATTVCAALWRQGILGSGRRVPRLQSCVDPSGVLAIWVVPARSGAVCRTLDMRWEPRAGSDPAARRAVALRGAIERRLARRCLGLGAARRAAREEIARLAMRRWRVTTSGRVPPGACVTPMLDGPARTVYLIAGG